jgi:hypothetical protein
MLPSHLFDELLSSNWNEVDLIEFPKSVNGLMVHAVPNGHMKMLKDQSFMKPHGVSKFPKLEQVSLSHFSETFQVPAASLGVAANQAPLQPFPAALSPGPVAVHVDGVRCFTPTDLGRRKGLSPQKFNRLLMEHGLQEKRHGQWCPTEAGKAFSVLLQVHKKQLAGTDVQQLKWKESVLAKLDGLA